MWNIYDKVFEDFDHLLVKFCYGGRLIMFRGQALDLLTQAKWLSKQHLSYHHFVGFYQFSFVGFVPYHGIEIVEIAFEL